VTKNGNEKRGSGIKRPRSLKPRAGWGGGLIKGFFYKTEGRTRRNATLTVWWAKNNAEKKGGLWAHQGGRQIRKGFTVEEVQKLGLGEKGWGNTG